MVLSGCGGGALTRAGEMPAVLLIAIAGLSVGAATLGGAAAARAPVGSSCGSAPTALNASTPNVLLIGDSISMGFGVSPSDTGYGYGLNVAKMLAGPYPEFYSKTLAGGLASVQHAGGFGTNGGDSANGVACIDQWLGDLQWDVITVNFGLHDCDPGGNSATYASNLETILTKARNASSKLIFVTTTPFHRYKDYSYPCVLRYNDVAKQVVKKLNGEPLLTSAARSSSIDVLDLFESVEDFCGTFLRPSHMEHIYVKKTCKVRM